MKILFVIKTLSCSQGGAERVLADVTSGLCEKSHDISVLSFDKEGERLFYPLNKGLHHIALEVGDVSKPSNLCEFINRAYAIRKIAKQTKPDAVIAFMHSTFVPASFGLIGTGIPVIASEHIVPAHYKEKWGEFILLWLSFLFVRKVTVLSPSIIQKYPALFRHKMIAISNAISPVQNPKIERGDDKKEKIVLSVGRLTKQKNQVLLINAFAKIADDFPDWNLRIIGEGELREALEKQISDLNLGDRITLPGNTSQIEREYENADIFALSSDYESFGMATAEALAHGVPALGFADCPGTNELIIDGENGLLISGVNRIDAMADGIVELMKSKKLRHAMGVKAPASVERYHPDMILKQWETLILNEIL